MTGYIQNGKKSLTSSFSNGCLQASCFHRAEQVVLGPEASNGTQKSFFFLVRQENQLYYVLGGLVSVKGVSQCA